MIKSKPCIVEDCNYPRFAKGYCKFHQNLRTDKKKPKPIRSQRKSIAPKSKKQAILDAKYSVKRTEFLSLPENQVCNAQVDQGCQYHTIDIHHRRGRGPYLLDTSTWLPCCRHCHDVIERNPIWAKENGFSEDRLSD